MPSGFSTVDFVIFGLFLALSVSIGMYHAWKAKGRQQRMKSINATSEFLMGGRDMPVLPTALSLLTTFMSGITILGTPAEVYQRGLLFWVYYMMAPLALLFSAFSFLPTFYKLGYVSIYEYFEDRFGSRTLTILAAVLFLINTLFYMGVVLYAPAVALSGVTGMPTWPFILLVGFCCITYTSIGGLKAVVWTDTIQASFIFGGLMALIVKGTIDAGGIVNIYDIASDTGRIGMLGQVDPNPAQHNSLWISIFGAFCLYLSCYGLNQMAMQRYCSLPTFRDAKISMLITMPLWALLGSMAVYIGLVMLAYFLTHGRNPMEQGTIKKQDQLVILFANDVLGVNGIPGLPGLFLACLFSSTLSTISSGINSMAAVTWQNLLRRSLGHRMNDNKVVLLNKMLVFTYGVIAVGLAFLAGPMGGIISAGINMMGALSGPMVGLFILGMFIRQASKWGAFIGLIVSALFNMWICLGNFITQPYKGYALPTNTSASMPPYDPHYGKPEVFFLYKVSGFLYPAIGILNCLIVGVLVSLLLPDRVVTGDDDNVKYRSSFQLQRKQRLNINTDDLENSHFKIEDRGVQQFTC